MIGVQTIGNATLIAYDQRPILSTDPWMGGDNYAFFGTWHLPYNIPDNLKKDIAESEYIWFSHGHPDHLNVSLSVSNLFDKEPPYFKGFQGFVDPQINTPQNTYDIVGRYYTLGFKLTY